jgi:hypothetical protein
MSTVGHLAAEIECGLRRAHPKLRKTVIRKLAARVAAALQRQTANTAAWAAVLPIGTERADMRSQWSARLLANARVECAPIVEPFARERLRSAAANGQSVVLSMEQTDWGDRFAIRMLSVRVGEGALPLIWAVEAGAANLGFEAQRALLESVLGWLPSGVPVLLAADRFYPAAPLLAWLQAHGSGYRLGLKGNHALDVGRVLQHVGHTRFEVLLHLALTPPAAESPRRHPTAPHIPTQSSCGSSSARSRTPRPSGFCAAVRTLRVSLTPLGQADMTQSRA